MVALWACFACLGASLLWLVRLGLFGRGVFCVFFCTIAVQLFGELIGNTSNSRFTLCTRACMFIQ